MSRSRGSTGPGPTPPAPRGPAAGWFPDPSGRAALRYWTGAAWSSWVSDGGPVRSDAPRPVMADDLEHLRFVEEVFLPHAAVGGLLDDTGRDRLTGLARQMAASTRPDAGAAGPVPLFTDPGWAAPAGPAAGASDVAPGVRRPVADSRGVGDPSAGGAAPAPAAGPGRVPAGSTAGAPTLGLRGAARGGPAGGRRAAPGSGRGGARTASAARAAAGGWWARRSSVGIDLAVHGLAYLGVVLLFVGVFGLVAFAFADVAPDLRPVAEVAAVAVPFGAARLLRSRGAEVVARALGVVGGLLVPLMVVTSLVDGAPLPPDPDAARRAAAMTVACVAVALVFALRTRVRPDAAVRYAAAPALWLAAAMAVLAVGRPVPGGADVAVPTAVQVFTLSLALAGCVGAARWRPGSPLGAATLRSATAALPVVVVLAVLTWVADGFPPVAVLATGVLVAGVAHGLPSVPARFLDVAAPVWWAGVTLAAATQLELRVVAAVAVAGFIALAELAVRQRRAAGALVWPVAGLAGWLVAGLLATAGPADPRSWCVVAAFAAVTAWAAARRTVRGGGPTSTAFGTLAAAAPAGLAASSGPAVGDVGAGLAAAVLLVATATIPASVPVLRRGHADHFWRLWWLVAVPVAAVAAVVTWSTAGVGGSRPDAAFALLLLALVVAAGPVPASVLPPAVAVLGVTGWLLLGDHTGASPWLTAGALAGAGAAVVLRGLLRPLPSVPRASQVLTGHGVGLVALAAAGTGWPAVAACALATAAWALTALVDEAGRPLVGAGARPLLGIGARPQERAGSRLPGEGARYVPWVVTAVGVPATAVLALDAAEVLDARGPWSGAVLSATAVVYAAAARLTARHRPRTTAVRGAVVAAAGGVVVAQDGWAAGAGDGWPLVAALVALCAAALLLPAPRPAVATWSAWAALAPLGGLLWWLGRAPLADREPVTVAAACLTFVGAALLVGAAAGDLRGQPWVPRAVPVHRALWAPGLVGAVQLGAGLVVGYGGGAPARALQVLTLVAGLVLLAVGSLARIGAPAGTGAVLAWLGALGLGGEALWRAPWPALLAAVGLLLAAELASRLGTERRWWARWDTAWLVASAPVAATTVLADVRYWSVVLVVVGLLCVAVALRLRRQAAVAEVLAWTGTVLVLLGAVDAGPGWPALALAGLAVGQAALATRARGGLRTVRQSVSAAAAVAAWWAGLAWLGLSPQPQLDLTAAAGGLVAVAAAAVVRRRRPERSWAPVWGVAGIVVAVAADLGTDIGVLGVASGATTAALFAVGGALGASAAPLRRPVLRDAAAVAGVAGLLTALDAVTAAGTTRVAALAVVSAVLGVMTLASLRRRADWRRPLLWTGTLLSVLAVLAAAPGPRPLLAAAVAAAAAQSAVAGVVLRVLGLQVLSPALGCTALLLLVSAAGQTHAYWYTVPIGLCLLVVVGLWRADQSARGRPVATRPIVTLELVGVGMLVGSPFVLAVTQSVLHALVAAGLAVLVAAWGLGTRVRRRAVAGITVFVAALVVFVVVPLVDLLPAWGGAASWVLLVVVGCGVVLAATMLERTRTAIQASRARLGTLLSGWE